MKKTFLKFCLPLAIGMTTAFFVSCGDDNESGTGTGIGEPTATTDPGVVINGVRWATRNLDVGGKFVAKPEDYGAYYQKGRPADGHESPTSATTATLATTDLPGHGNFIIDTVGYDWRSPENNKLWNAGTESAPVKTANDPSPAGWRVPTCEDFRKLLDRTKVNITWDDTKKGCICTDIATGESVFFPAASSRKGEDGDFYSRPEEHFGFYWSSLYVMDTPRDGNTSFYFNNTFAMSGELEDMEFSTGCSVRCVAE